MKTAKKKPVSIKWSYRAGYSAPVPASVVGPELERIASAEGVEIANLKPSIVVEHASDPKSPLYPCFESDDSSAAHKWRVSQARRLIAGLAFVIVEPSIQSAPFVADVKVDAPVIPRPQIAFVHIKHETEGNCYVSSRDAMANPDLRKKVIRDALAALSGLQRRYSDLAELAEVFETIDRAKQKFA